MLLNAYLPHRLSKIYSLGNFAGIIQDSTCIRDFWTATYTIYCPSGPTSGKASWAQELCQICRLRICCRKKVLSDLISSCKALVLAHSWLWAIRMACKLHFPYCRRKRHWITAVLSSVIMGINKTMDLWHLAECWWCYYFVSSHHQGALSSTSQSDCWRTGYTHLDCKPQTDVMKTEQCISRAGRRKL